jgi:hypothetical protein
MAPAPYWGLFEVVSLKCPTLGSKKRAVRWDLVRISWLEIAEHPMLS